MHFCSILCKLENVLAFYCDFSLSGDLQFPWSHNTATPALVGLKKILWFSYRIYGSVYQTHTKGIRSDRSGSMDTIFPPYLRGRPKKFCQGGGLQEGGWGPNKGFRLSVCLFTTRFLGVPSLLFLNFAVS